MTNIIEPCCAERQLGQLLREAHGHAVIFQTNGDVTAKLFIKDTMLLSGDRPRTLTIAVSEMPQEAMRFIGRYAQLGYIATLRLMVHESDIALHPAFPDCEVQLALLPDDQPIPELMMWSGSSHTVVIQGTMPNTVSPALHLYAGLLCGNQSLTLHAATAAFEALFRARRVELTTLAAGEGEAATSVLSADAQQQAGQAEPKKKSNRKKAKNNEVEPTKQLETTSPAEESTEATA